MSGTGVRQGLLACVLVFFSWTSLAASLTVGDEDFKPKAESSMTFQHCNAMATYSPSSGFRVTFIGKSIVSHIRSSLGDDLTVVLNKGAELTTGVDRPRGAENAVYAGGALTIEGPGTLNVASGGIYSSGDLEVFGSIVHMVDNGRTGGAALQSFGGTVRIELALVSISGTGPLVAARKEVKMTASLVNLLQVVGGKWNGNAAVDAHDISVVGCAVTMVAKRQGFCADGGDILVTDSCVTVVSDGHCFSSWYDVSFLNVRLAAISQSSNVAATYSLGIGERIDTPTVNNIQPVTFFGDGKYVMASASGKATALSGKIEIDGGEIEACAPAAAGMRSWDFVMRDGSLKMVEEIRFRNCYQEIMAKGVVAAVISKCDAFTGWTDAHTAFLLSMLEQFDATLKSDPKGRADAVIQSRTFLQSGGEIAQGTAKSGHFACYFGKTTANIETVDIPVLAGGVFNGWFQTGGKLKGKKYDCYDLNPVNANGEVLHHVDRHPYWVVTDGETAGDGGGSSGERPGAPGEEETGTPSTASAASTYVGYCLDDDGHVVGEFTLKTGRAMFVGNKTRDKGLVGARKCSLSLTVYRFNEKDVSTSGALNLETGKVEWKSDVVPEFTLEKDDLSGSLCTGSKTYKLVGRRNIFTAKPPEKVEWLKSLNGYVTTVVLAPKDQDASAPKDGYSVLSVTVGAHGKTKVAGTLANGEKIGTIGQVMVTADGRCAVPVLVRTGARKADGFGFVLCLDALDESKALVERMGDLNGQSWQVVSVGSGKAPSGTSYFNLGGVWPALEGQGLETSVLPQNEPVVLSAKKWSIAKPGKVRTDSRGRLKGEGNISGLKLSYQPKTGLFSGSFTVYCQQGGRLKKQTAKVSGALSDGVGYGFARLDSSASAVPIVIGDYVDFPEDQEDEPAEPEPEEEREHEEELEPGPLPDDPRDNPSRPAETNDTPTVAQLAGTYHLWVCLLQGDPNYDLGVHQKDDATNDDLTLTISQSGTATLVGDMLGDASGVSTSVVMAGDHAEAHFYISLPRVEGGFDFEFDLEDNGRCDGKGWSRSR